MIWITLGLFLAVLSMALFADRSTHLKRREIIDRIRSRGALVRTFHPEPDWWHVDLSSLGAGAESEASELEARYPNAPLSIALGGFAA